MDQRAGNPLPSILVTGASGFIGRNFVEAAKDHFRIIGLSRSITERPQVADHPNVEWLVADIGNIFVLRKTLASLRVSGGVDYILHLASFYDFNYDDNPEYLRTNIRGTRNLLDQARQLNIKRFIFASSLAACEFSHGEIITEKSPANAKFTYAESKRIGEELLREYSEYFPCTAVRMAAAFSDWCEYGPLYVFLQTWLNKGWKRRILGGKGKSAITYIHINCLVKFFLKLISMSQDLPRFDIYIASPNEPVTHRELFDRATRYFYGRRMKAVFMPKPVATIGVYAMDILGMLTGKHPFERPWMMRYVDKQLRVDSAYTRQVIGWQPTDRFRMQRRLLFMIERMKSYPYEWHKRNTKMLKTIPMKPHFMIYEMLDFIREKVVQRIIDHVMSEDQKETFVNYRLLDEATYRKDIIAVYQFLSAAVRTRDRMSMLEYARQTALLRWRQGFPFGEVRASFSLVGDVVTDELLKLPSLKGMEQLVYDEVAMIFQLMLDEIEGTYEEANQMQSSTLPPTPEIIQ
jgi:nucleoside-diphosphate-sugar epimerase